LPVAAREVSDGPEQRAAGDRLGHS
jgi:hypothetical protein